MEPQHRKSSNSKTKDQMVLMEQFEKLWVMIVPLTTDTSENLICKLPVQI